eukprot:264456-Chlamydomonas_euryale.AAC.7
MATSQTPLSPSSSASKWLLNASRAPHSPVTSTPQGHRMASHGIASHGIAWHRMAWHRMAHRTASRVLVLGTTLAVTRPQPFTHTHTHPRCCCSCCTGFFGHINFRISCHLFSDFAKSTADQA